MIRLAFVVLLTTSCAVREIDLGNLSCDRGTCLPGWVCDPVSSTCVPEGALGDSTSGDVRTGDPWGGPGDQSPGDPGGFGDPGFGDPGFGDPGFGDPGLGDPGLGDPGLGDPGLGDPGLGDPGLGDPGLGDPGLGDPGSGGDPAASCTVWRTDFSSDPTASDDNGDGENDWRMRDGNSFPTGQLSGGVWVASSGSGALDTNPNNDFTGSTTVEVRMRATSEGARGAVFWINVDYAGGRFAPLCVALELLDTGQQHLSLTGKSVTGADEQLIQLGPLGTGFQTIGLDIQPATNRVTLSLNGMSLGSRAYNTIAPQNDDKWATVLAWGASAEFDEVSVETCTP